MVLSKGTTMKRKSALTGMILLLASFNSFAIVGAGFHWGFDFTSSMDDVLADDVFSISDLNLTDLPANILDDETSFLNISRSGFERTPINFGGKIFIDILPIEFEASVNMGVWQYDGVINYIDIESINPIDPSLEYTSQPVTIESLGADSYFGVDKTPYGKFQLDLTAKKTFDVPFIKPSVGVGYSVHFATPVLSSELVNDALDLGGDLSSISPDALNLNSTDTYKKILDEILDGAKKPQSGMHILVGLKAKLPVIPIALYADGKYNIVFNDVASDEKFTTKGILVNVGIMLNI